MSPITKKLTVSNKNEAVLNLSLGVGSMPIRSPSILSSSSMSYNEMEIPSSPSSSSSSLQDMSTNGGGSGSSSTGGNNGSTSNGKRQYGRVNRIVLDKNSDEYRKRRERNNMAVKKSRNKSKVRTQQTLQRVAELKAENERLETKVKILSKELSFLKDLFLAHAGSSHTGQSVGEVLFSGSHEAPIAGSVSAPTAITSNGISSPINSNIISSTGTSLVSNDYDTGMLKSQNDGIKESYHISTDEDSSNSNNGH